MRTAERHYLATLQSQLPIPIPHINPLPFLVAEPPTFTLPFLPSPTTSLLTARDILIFAAVLI